MKTIKILVILISFTFVLSACSKGNDNTITSSMDQIEKVVEVNMELADETDKTDITEKAMENSIDQVDQSTEVSKDQSTNVSMMNKGDFAPDFTLLDVAGKEHKLTDYAGEKIYIKFWASWCSICLAGLEDLNTFAGDDNNFVILTVVSPGYKNEKKSDDFIEWFDGVENVSNINVLLDEEGTLAQELGIRGYPTSAYIGSDGVLVKTRPGHVFNEDITAEFETIY